MTIVNFRGDAQAIAQVQTFTVSGTVSAGNWVQVTINRKYVRYTVLGTETNAAGIASGLQAALTASNIPEFLEITWSVSSAVVTGTGKIAGVPFTATVSDSGGSASLATSVTTSATGPYHWDNAGNWDTGSVPANNQTINIASRPGLTVAIKYGINTSLSNVSLNIGNALVGLPDQNDSGYVEYRDRYLRLQAPQVSIDSTGTGLIRLDLNSNGTNSTLTAFQISGTPSPSVQNAPAVQIINTNQNSTLNILQGSIGVAWGNNETASFATINIGYETSISSDVFFYSGVGASITTLNQSGGIASLRNGVTSLNMGDGTLTLYSGNITTLDGQGGSFSYLGNGTIGSLVCGTDFTADFSKDLRGKVVTNCTLYPKSTLIDSFKVVTFTNPILVNGCSLSEITLNLGTNFHLQRS